MGPAHTSTRAITAQPHISTRAHQEPAKPLRKTFWMLLHGACYCCLATVCSVFLTSSARQSKPTTADGNTQSLLVHAQQTTTTGSLSPHGQKRLVRCSHTATRQQQRQASQRVEVLSPTDAAHAAPRNIRQPRGCLVTKLFLLLPDDVAANVVVRVCVRCPSAVTTSHLSNMICSGRC
jgi:hypothetical protein